MYGNREAYLFAVVVFDQIKVVVRCSVVFRLVIVFLGKQVLELFAAVAQSLIDALACFAGEN